MLHAYSFIFIFFWLGVGAHECSTQTPQGVPGAGVTGCVWNLPRGTLKEQYTLNQNKGIPLLHLIKIIKTIKLK